MGNWVSFSVHLSVFFKKNWGKTILFQNLFCIFAVRIDCQNKVMADVKGNLKTGDYYVSGKDRCKR